MAVKIKDISREAFEYFCEQGTKNRYGDITVTITMNDGVPVKLTKSYCEHIAKRKTEKVVPKEQPEEDTSIPLIS